MKFKDYYKILGVERGVSGDDLQKSFRKLARQYHPDVNKAKEAEERFKEINEAYEVLKDPDKRARYDALGANWQSGQEFRPPPGWNKQAGGFSFDIGGSGGPAGFSSMGGFSDFFETLFGGGGGNIFGAAGQAFNQQQNFNQRQEQEARDLLVQLNVEPWQAALGAKVTVELPDKSKVKLSIPQGTQPGTKLRLKGKGLPLTGTVRGDAYVEIGITIPKQLSKEEKEAYENLARASGFNPRAREAA